MTHIEIMKVEREVLLERRGRHYMFPAAGLLPGNEFALLFHDAPARDPASYFDPESQLSIVTGAAPGELGRDTLRPVPRFASSGYSPSIVPLSEDRLLILDNSWHIYNWMGEAHVRQVEGHDWVLVLRGAHVIEVDASGDTLKFGKPRRINSLDFPVTSCYGPPIIDGNTIFCTADYNIDAHQLDDRPWETLFMKTEDLGHTWDMVGKLYFEPDQPELPKLYGPCAARTGDGSFVCALSTMSGTPEIFFTRSSDSGKTWAEPAPSGIMGGNHWLTHLGDARLMLSVSPLNPGEDDRIDIFLSTDNGASFHGQKRIIVEKKKKTPAGCGTPRPLLLPDGSIYFTFYSNAVKDTRSICGCRMEL